MAWEVEFSEEFGFWWDSLSADEQESVDFGVRLLQERGPYLKPPYADTIRGSKHPNMNKPRCQHDGRPYRVLFAFDPRRVGLLLIGGDKTGNPRWYEEFVPMADEIYERHLSDLSSE